MIKYVAKWKRKARLARERRAAEAAIAVETEANQVSIGGEQRSSISGLQQHLNASSDNAVSSRIRLGPLKLGSLRRPSASKTLF